MVYTDMGEIGGGGWLVWGVLLVGREREGGKGEDKGEGDEDEKDEQKTKISKSTKKNYSVHPTQPHSSPDHTA